MFLRDRMSEKQAQIFSVYSKKARPVFRKSVHRDMEEIEYAQRYPTRIARIGHAPIISFFLVSGVVRGADHDAPQVILGAPGRAALSVNHRGGWTLP
jgi:hypothetical protein